MIKKIALLTPLLLILLSITPVQTAEYAVGGVGIGTITGININTILGSLEVSAISNGAIAFSYVENGNPVNALYDTITKTLYKYNNLPDEYFAMLKTGQNILEIFSTPPALLSPTPKTYLAIISQNQELLDGKLVEGARYTRILAAKMEQGILTVVIEGTTGYAVITSSDTSIGKYINISTTGYDSALIDHGMVYLVSDASTLIVDTATNTAEESNNPVYPVIGSDAYIAYENGNLVLVNNAQSYKLVQLENTPIFAEGYYCGNNIYAVVIQNGEDVELIIANTDKQTLLEYSIETGYTELTQVKLYSPYKIELLGDNLVIVYSTKDTYSNRLLYTTINIDKIMEKPETIYKGIANYPSTSVKSITTIKLVQNTTLEKTTSTTTINTANIDIQVIQLQDSTTKRDLETTSITSITTSINGVKLTIDAPDKTVNYGDYELAGLTWTVKATLNNIGVQGINATLVAKVYVDNQYYKTIRKSTITDNQGRGVIRITREDINKTGNIYIEWNMNVYGYKINDTITIKYPYPRTPTATPTTTIQGGNTTKTTPAQTTTTQGQTTTPQGGTTTHSGAGGTPTTTTPKGGLSPGLIAAIVVIVAVIVGIGLVLFRKK